MDIAPYRKLVAAIVGLAILFAARRGIDLGGANGEIASMIVEIVISGAAAFGVWLFPNRQQKKQP